MDWRDKKVFVTGADGFIGSHLAERLVEVGACVRALTYYNAQNRWGWLEDLSPDVLDAIEIFPGDLRDPGTLARPTKGVDFVFHLGALVAIPYSYTAPRSYIETNVLGALNILEAALAGGAGCVIHTSTSEVYGTAQYVPMDEKHPINARSPYAASKVAADQLALSFYRSHSLPLRIVRPFNTYGPRQSTRAVIPTIILQALTAKEKGKGKIKLGALHPRRDFNYVKDVVEGILSVAGMGGGFGEVFHLGTGKDWSIGEICEMIQVRLGTAFATCQDAERLRPPKSEVECLCCDAQKIRDATAHTPVYSIEKGLDETIAWFTKKRNIFGAKSYSI